MVKRMHSVWMTLPDNDVSVLVAVFCSRSYADDFVGSRDRDGRDYFVADMCSRCVCEDFTLFTADSAEASRLLGSSCSRCLYREVCDEAR